MSKKKSLFHFFHWRSARSRKLEESLYERVMYELTKGELNPGLWTKALAEAEMDELKAQGIYLKLRVQSLKDEKLVNSHPIDEIKIPVGSTNQNAADSYGHRSGTRAENKKDQPNPVTIDALAALSSCQHKKSNRLLKRLLAILMVLFVPNFLDWLVYGRTGFNPLSAIDTSLFTYGHWGAIPLGLLMVKLAIIFFAWRLWRRTICQTCGLTF